MSAKSPSRSNKTVVRAGVGQHAIPLQPRSKVLPRLVVLSLLAFALYTAYMVLDPIKDRFYIFDHQHLHQLAQQALEANKNNTRGVIDHIVKELRTTHGPAIASQEEWFFNNAGGAMGAMTIIHASITEYLIIFGTPLGTEGHTGRHTADDYFNILEGEQWAFSAGALDKEVYPAGSVHHLVRGQVKQYKMHEGCWAMELAQGWIPPMMPFGLADIFFSTLDLETCYHTIRITGKEMLRNLFRGKI